jgi:hypothetical protein
VIIVRPGERSPRVALIQILLNRQGSDLKVDGQYGSKTRTAVNAFQTANGISGKGGVVGPETWSKLPLGDNTEVVDVVDVGDPSISDNIVQQLSKAGGDPIQLGQMCGGVEQMVHEAIYQVESPGTIALLRIIGHGNLGRWMTVSVGEVAHLSTQNPKAYAATAKETHSYIDWGHVNDVASTLSRLRPYFAPYGMMEHGGCSLGSRPETRSLMQRLADLWGVPVTVGVGLQNSVLNFDGQIFTAFPKHGTLDSWTKPFREASY